MGDPGRQTLSAKDVMKVVCDSLRELRDSEGVTPVRVCQYVKRKYGDVTEKQLLLELHRGVREGFLVSKAGRYNINNTICTPKKTEKSPSSTAKSDPSKSELSTKQFSTGSESTVTSLCGCPSKKRRSASRKRRGCKRRRSGSRKSSRSRGRMVCKKVCKRVGGKKSPGLIKRLMSLLTGGGKKGCKKIKKAKKKFSWVRSHCRKNNLRKRKRRKC